MFTPLPQRSIAFHYLFIVTQNYFSFDGTSYTFSSKPHCELNTRTGSIDWPKTNNADADLRKTMFPGNYVRRTLIPPQPEALWSRRGGNLHRVPKSLRDSFDAYPRTVPLSRLINFAVSPSSALLQFIKPHFFPISFRERFAPLIGVIRRSEYTGRFQIPIGTQEYFVGRKRSAGLKVVYFFFFL